MRLESYFPSQEKASNEAAVGAASLLGLEVRNAELAKRVARSAELASEDRQLISGIPVSRDRRKRTLQGKSRFEAAEKLSMAQALIVHGQTGGYRMVQKEIKLTDENLVAPALRSILRWKDEVEKSQNNLRETAKTNGLPRPSQDALDACAKDALGDKRSTGNKAVPQDAIDFITQWAQDTEAAEIVFHRNDLRDEMLLYMGEFYPDLVKSDEGTGDGWFTCSEDFMRSLERRAHLTKRRITSAGSDSSLPTGMTEDSAKQLMRARLAMIVYEDPLRPIFAELTLGVDETGVHLIPLSGLALATEGSKTVKRKGFGDKRQVTCMLSHAFDGTVLPVQLIFGGKTSRVLPSIDAETVRKYQALMSCTPSHWSTDESVIDWLKFVAIPYLLRKKRSMKLAADYPSLIVWDVWHAHRSAKVLQFIKQRAPWLKVLFVIARCTSFLQVCDVSMNKPLKTSCRLG